MAERASTPPPQGYQDASGGILATTILVTVIAIVLLILRLATRIWIVKRVGWDDWTILFAVLGHPIGMALVIVQISYGLGKPVYYLTDHQYREFMKYAYGEWLQVMFAGHIRFLLTYSLHNVDFCNSDVYQSVDMLVSPSNYCHQTV